MKLQEKLCVEDLVLPFHREFVSLVYHYVPLRTYFLIGLTCKTMREIVNSYPSQKYISETYEKDKEALHVQKWKLNQSDRDLSLRTLRPMKIKTCVHCLRYSCHLRDISDMLFCRHCELDLFVDLKTACDLYYLTPQTLSKGAQPVRAGRKLLYFKLHVFQLACEQWSDNKQGVNIDAANDDGQGLLHKIEQDVMFCRQRLRARVIADGQDGGAVKVMYSRAMFERIEQREQFVYVSPNPMAKLQRSVPWLRNGKLIHDSRSCEEFMVLPRLDAGWLLEPMVRSPVAHHHLYEKKGPSENTVPSGSPPRKTQTRIFPILKKSTSNSPPSNQPTLLTSFFSLV